MPTVTATPAPVVTPTPAATPVQVFPRAVSAHLKRDKGKIILRCDVSGLHNYLDSLGIEIDTQYHRYASAPPVASGADVVNTADHTLSTRALLSRKYWKDPTTNQIVPGMLQYDLLVAYQTPPNVAALQSIADSIEVAYHAIISHYQPVEISVSLVRKPLPAPVATAPAATPGV